MVTIPMMRRPEEVRKVRMTRIGLSLLIGVVVPLILWAVHSYYIPFDELASKIAGRIGLKL